MQVWDPDRYAAHARFVSDLGAPVIELLEPQPGERVLDLGCGDGALTEKLVDAGCRVVAVDSSPEQVRAARERGIDARVADATALGFDGEFDAVFSNAVLHWIRDPDAALTAIHRALAPGGRLVAEFGGHGCVASIRAAFGEVLAGRDIDAEILNPWYFPTAEEYRARLDANGFDVDSIRLFPRPTPLPSDLTDWLETFAQPYLAAVPKRDRRAILNQMRERLEPVLRTPDGDWFADYVRLRFAAARRD
ncbi:MAG: methyltransferase domain-containing protein [Acidobacteria bacterium]|nr:methyltransferase domain-containing protein [Acidobacteriota bacterium]